MNKKEFQQKLDSGAKKIKVPLRDESSNSLRLLAEILLVWYARREMAKRRLRANGERRKIGILIEDRTYE